MVFQSEKSQKNWIENKMIARLKRNIVLDYIGTFVTNLNMQSSIWVLYLAYCGLNLAQIGLVEGIYHATSILFEIPSGAVADLLGRKRSMVLSKLCIAVSCVSRWGLWSRRLETTLIPARRRRLCTTA